MSNPYKPVKSASSAIKGTRNSLGIQKPFQNLRTNGLLRTSSGKTYSLTDYGIPSEKRQLIRRSSLGSTSQEDVVGADQPIEEVGRGFLTKTLDEFVNASGEPFSKYYKQTAKILKI
jgi:hypothetical protein